MNPTTSMNPTVEPEPTDTSDMIGLHQVFRDALAAVPQLVGAVTADDRSRAETVGTYYDNVLRLLNVHHAGEDELLTPRLLERCPAEAKTISSVAEQHHAVQARLTAVITGLAAWRTDPSEANRDALVAAFDALQSALISHLDDEEKFILPVAARHISPAEWGELPGHGMRHFDGDKLWLITGLIREHMTPEQRSAMDTHMPPPVAATWRATGQGAYLEFVTELRDA